MGRIDSLMVSMLMPAILRYLTAPATSMAVNFVSTPIRRTYRAMRSKRVSKVAKSLSATRRMLCADCMMLEYSTACVSSVRRKLYAM